MLEDLGAQIQASERKKAQARANSKDMVNICNQESPSINIIMKLGDLQTIK
jgi:hypothetical protein